MEERKQIIYKTIQRVAEDRAIQLEMLHDDAALVDTLGLRSLDLARILAILELKLNVNPFAELVSITSVRTVGDLCAAYDKAFAGETQEEERPGARQPRRVISAEQRNLRRGGRDQSS
ncbi:MAG: hypothetical protein KBG20_00345 [Caldilineaceae bacterium]|nr:hypothetical protein [Caldilineaceae bacterium]MBP8107387.1 hypothetical protein [Caldilineaceae bacterium]MBP8124179.1 hypothetical protein [Caldilineaceae bacterium]MBP9070707.1 hypothetical protein [Caldilineaceae bacterium]